MLRALAQLPRRRREVIVLRPGDSLLVIQKFSVATGKIVGRAYVGGAGEAASSSLSADSSGQYLLLADGFGAHHGWIHDGHLHVLPPTNGDGEPMAW